MGKPLVHFKADLTKLNKNQETVLELLIQAAKLIVPIYLAQENHNFPGANFYPHDSSKEEIEDAAKKNPAILSPYTVVAKDGKGFKTTAYHEKYAPILVPIAKKLEEAADLTENKDFGKRLEFQAKALLEGKYDEAAIYWMSMKPYILDIVIGPIERYDDKLFFTKTAYQAWVGIMDEAESKKISLYKKIILNSRRKTLMPSEKVDYYDKVQTRVDDAVIFTGLIARTMFVGVNLPNDPNLMEKYGSEITVFKQVNEHRLRTGILPTFSKIFSPDFKKQFSKEDIERGSLYLIVLHELAHTYLRYRDSERRLQDLFPVIDELSAYVLGIKVAGTLLLKDITTTKELESLMLALILRSFYLILDKKNDKSMIHYTTGGAIFINYLYESGALVKNGGLSWPNFTKIFVSLSDLASVLERILSIGTREDAAAFIKKYGNLEIIRNLQ